MVKNELILLYPDDTEGMVFRTWHGPGRKPRIIRVTHVHHGKLTYVYAMVDPDVQEEPGVSQVKRAESIVVEIVRPYQHLTQLNADDYHSSLPDGSQVFVRLNY